MTIQIDGLFRQLAGTSSDEGEKNLLTGTPFQEKNNELHKKYQTMP